MIWRPCPAAGAIVARRRKLFSAKQRNVLGTAGHYALMRTDAPRTANADCLPSDAKLIKSLVAELAHLLQMRDERIAQLQRHMDLLVWKMYGRSSEKLAEGQGTLFET